MYVAIRGNATSRTTYSLTACFLLSIVDKLTSVEWRVDYILSSSSIQDLNAPSVQLKLNIAKNINGEKSVEPVAFELNADKFRVLLHELKAARGLMEGL